ncbi:ret finger protein-like 4A [Choloepus didactylus]|uniref:ret finger protein-like 4A n=1 Tax=Choloepus didactylus TaxID=27675 RepID=UPI00189F1DBB|nr:ret finger protein-like 4A [Choloepus didactylus]
MAEHFKEVSRCPICLEHLEKPVYLKCGYVCCLHCTTSLQKEPRGEGLLCPSCPVVSQKNDVRPNRQLGGLVSRVRDLEPHLRAALQMNPRMLKFQVDMTLDVDTANEFLIISDDLRSVRCGTIKQKLKDSAERFSYSICVLGSLQFTSGRHYWEVDVGTNKDWDLGVCKESVLRLGEIRLSPNAGFWTLSLRNGSYLWACTTPPTAVWVTPRLHHVGIFLDMDIGSISFFNISDGSHIFTFTRISTAVPLRPFFSPSSARNGDKDTLRICSLMNPRIPFFTTTQDRPVNPR